MDCFLPWIHFATLAMLYRTLLPRPAVNRPLRLCVRAGRATIVRSSIVSDVVAALLTSVQARLESRLGGHTLPECAFRDLTVLA